MAAGVAKLAESRGVDYVEVAGHPLLQLALGTEVMLIEARGDAGVARREPEGTSLGVPAGSRIQSVGGRDSR
jgi:hypothetical protein